MIQIKNLTSSDRLFLKKIKKIYETAFPPDERRDIKEVIGLISDKRFQLFAVLFDNKVVGMLSKWDFDNFLYIEHFAISEKYRNRGLGSNVLQKLMLDENRRIVLEVEMMTDDLSLKRIKFYERFDFRICPEPYIQPAYDKDKKAIPMMIMAKQEISSEQEFQYIMKTLHQEVYGFYV